MKNTCPQSDGKYNVLANAYERESGASFRGRLAASENKNETNWKNDSLFKLQDRARFIARS